MQVTHRLIRLFVKVFADVFALIPGMVVSIQDLIKVAEAINLKSFATTPMEVQS